MPFLFQVSPSRVSARTVAIACLMLAAAFIARAENLSTDSPFMPAPGDAAMAAVAASAKIQLAGMGEVNGKTWVCLFDTEKRKSHWFAVGTTTDGIQVVSCDDARSQAVIRAGGETITLTLRKPTKTKPMAIAMTPPTPAPTVQPQPIMPAVGASPGGMMPIMPAVRREDKEREARMLVSDLMEIGMRQRKAYEEAQKKAAAEAAAKQSQMQGK